MPKKSLILTTNVDTTSHCNLCGKIKGCNTNLYASYIASYVASYVCQEMVRTKYIVMCMCYDHEE